jgi:hypothetical protein
MTEAWEANIVCAVVWGMGLYILGEWIHQATWRERWLGLAACLVWAGVCWCISHFGISFPG